MPTYRPDDWQEPDPEPDTWTNGDWLAVLIPVVVLVLVPVVWVLETLFARK